MTPCCASSPATPTGCRRWRSPRTAPGWPPPATTRRCGSGTRTPAQTRHTLTGHTGTVPALAVAPDGTWLASAGDDGDGADLGPAHRAGPPHPHRPHRHVCRRGGRPGRHLAGLRRRRRRRCGSGTRTPADPPHPHRPHRHGVRRWRSPRTAPGWPPPATTGRCGSGTRTPGRPATPSPATPARCGVGGGPRRHLAGLRQRATTRCGSGTRTPAGPPHPHRPHRPGGGAGGRPGRHPGWPPPATTARCGSGTRTPGRPATPSPATPAGCGRWRWPRTAPGWPPPATTGRCGSGTRTPAQARHTLTGHTDPVRALAVAPDGTWLASASDDGRCGSGTRTPGRPATPSPATPTRCGRWRSPRTARWLASASDDGTVRIWDVDAGHCVASLRTGHALGALSWPTEHGSPLQVSEVRTSSLSLAAEVESRNTGRRPDHRGEVGQGEADAEHTPSAVRERSSPRRRGSFASRSPRPRKRGPACSVSRLTSLPKVRSMASRTTR